MATDIRGIQWNLNASDQASPVFRQVGTAISGVQASYGKLVAVLGGAGVVGAFALSIKRAIDQADEFNKLSQKVGVAVAQLTALDYAFELSDVSREGYTTGLKKLSTAMFDAASGGKEMQGIFKGLGIAFEEAPGKLKQTDVMLLEVAEKFSKMEDGSAKAALAVKLFGRQGLELIPFLNQGAAGIGALMREAERLGVVMTKEMTEAAEKFNDNMKAVERSSFGAKVAMARDLLPALNRIAEAMKEAAIEAGFLRAVLVGIGGVFSEAFRASDLEQLKAVDTTIAGLTSRLDQLNDRPGPYARFNDKQKADAADALNRALTERASIQRRIALAEAKPDAPPARPDFDVSGFGGVGGRGAAAEKISEYDRELDRLAKAAIQVQHLTELEATRNRVNEGLFGTLQAGHVTELENRARIVDLNREIAAALKQDEEAKKQWREDEDQRQQKEKQRLKEARDGYIALIDPVEKYRKQLIEADKLLEKGLLTRDQWGVVTFKINDQIDAAMGLNKELKQTKTLGEEIGHVFSSAFEDAILHGKKFADVLRGIMMDFAKLFLREQVTKPLATAAGKLFDGIDWGNIFGFKAEGGPVSAGMPYIVGEKGPELFMPRQAGSIVPNGALAGGGGTYYIDARGADAGGLARLEGMIRQLNGSIEPRALNAVSNARQRGGAFSGAMGR